MKIAVSADRLEKIRTDGAVIPVFEDETFRGSPGQVDRRLGGMIARVIKNGGFKPSPGAVHLLYPEGRIMPERLLLAGMGKRSELSLYKVRQASGRAAAALRSAGAQNISISAEGIDLNVEETAQALIEGALLGLYQFLKYKTGEERKRKDIQSITLLSPTAAMGKAMQRGARTGGTIAGSAALARDMVNSPGADMTPAAVAAIARKIAKEFKLKLQVLERRQMEKLGMGALLGVSAGSAQPPKFIILEYRKGGKNPFVALVGKTITFDSGGISIKPAEGMDKMKDDMSGGAAVLGAIRNAAALRLPLNIVALLPACENMPGGKAYRPGDILRTLSNQTIEIINTDAEGRVILADALTYACRYKPAAIIDIATLTGACRVALGQEASGLLGNDAALISRIREAGDKTGERAWELPLWEGYYENIKSDIADMKNAGGRDGGVITAAALLSRFVEKYPWAHLDIAATAWADRDRPYIPKGATGVGTRLLTQFLRDWAAAKQ